MNKTDSQRARQFVLYLVLFLVLLQRSISPHSITFIAKRHPAHTRQAIKQLRVKTATKIPPLHLIPQYLTHHIMTLPGFIGLSATYAGYIALSDRTGQITFPKKQQKDALDLIVTKQIVPVTYAKSKLIHHWEIKPGTETATYRIERKEDTYTKLYYWTVTSIPTAQDGKIPLHSIVIFAYPKTIYIPEGITLTSDSPNLVLPTIYVKNSFDTVHNSLYLLSIRRFFETPELFYKNRPYGYAQLEGTVD